MSYAVAVSSKVRDSIQSLPFDLAEQVWDHIELLLADPLGRGRRAEFPRGSGQSFQFDAESGGLYYLFSLSFCYRDTADENQILITDLTMTTGEDIE